jgi:5-methylcytosine-specific restriction protein B
MSAASPPSVPEFRKFMNPCLAVLRRHGQALTNEELDVAVGAEMRLPPDVLAVLHDPDKNPKPEAYYRLAWARSYLKRMGLIDNATRGSWQITPKGRTAGEIDPAEVARLVTSGVNADSLAADVSDALAEELLSIHQRMVEAEGNPAGDVLASYHARFRERFGPDALRAATGERLLALMHGRGTRDSLVYWLEFKNDEDFPGAFFGSIAGGSALKFGIYQSTETQHWMTGHPSSQQKLSVREAIARVEQQRDQLVRGADVLAACRPETVDYRELQREITLAAPDLAESAWGHKYFALLFPEILDTYHNVSYQKYHLIRLQKIPAEGRYENARYFAGIARQLGIPITHLGPTLNIRHGGEPRTFWRLGTTAGDTGESEWPRMKSGGFASVGWSETGSLEGVEINLAGKEHVRALIGKHFPREAAVTTKSANQLFAFVANVRRGDTIVAMQGATVLGIGEATGDYFFEPNDGRFAHRRPVSWRSFEEWKLPKPEGMRTTFVPLGRQAGNLVEIVRRLDTPTLEETQTPAAPLPATSTPSFSHAPLTGVLGRVQSALNRKGQVILCGPPGTGKTYWAIGAMRELAARSWFGRPYEELSDDQRASLVADGAIAQCTFHPAYGYEEFIVGYRPAVEQGTLTFVPRPGIFATLCERAMPSPTSSSFS